MLVDLKVLLSETRVWPPQIPCTARFSHDWLFNSLASNFLVLEALNLSSKILWTMSWSLENNTSVDLPTLVTLVSRFRSKCDTTCIPALMWEIDLCVQLKQSYHLFTEIVYCRLKIYPFHKPYIGALSRMPPSHFSIELYSLTCLRYRLNGPERTSCCHFWKSSQTPAAPVCEAGRASLQEKYHERNIPGAYTRTLKTLQHTLSSLSFKRFTALLWVSVHSSPEFRFFSSYRTDSVRKRGL